MKPPQLVIVGATATGKSAVALAAARLLGAEIVCVDAMTVYRGMDIGTAKAGATERAEIPHHLLDLFEPTEESSLARFVEQGRSVLADLERRGVPAVLVGGTGLYVDALVDDLELPGRWPGIRARLEAELADGSSSPEQLHARLAALDPLAASRIEPGNARRSVRALEVCLGSGRPFSSFGPGLQAARERSGGDRSGSAHAGGGDGGGGDGGGGVGRAMVGIRRSRASLAARIRARYEAQLAAGFVEEAAGLLARHGDALSRTACQALGYREIWDALEHGTPIADAVETAITRTFAFAKRQERWFRRDPRITWLDADALDRSDGPDADAPDADAPDAVAELARRSLERLGHWER